MPGGELERPGGFWEGGAFVPEQCGRCRQRFYGTPRCHAFPDGIPLAVLAGRIDHRRPIDGDQGIRFTPLPPSEPEGPLRYVYVHHGAQHAGQRYTVGALWYSEANDAVGFAPAPGWESSAEYAEWLARVYRGGASIARSGLELYEGWIERCSGLRWDCSEGDDAGSIDVLRERLSRLPRSVPAG